MAESSMLPVAPPLGGSRSLPKVLAEGLLVFALLIGSFGSLAYGFYHRWEWYSVTYNTLAASRSAGVAETVLTKLGSLKDKKFDTEAQFLDQLRKVLDTPELAGAHELLLKNCHFESRWPSLACFLAIVGLFITYLSVLRGFFGKSNGRLVFGFWLISMLGAYFFFLFHNNKYPMGIDLAGGTELIYRLDYSQTDRNIEAVEKQLKEAKAKDPNSDQTRELNRQKETLDSAKKSAPDKAAEVVRRRVDPTGTKGIPVTTLGNDKERLRIQLPRATEEEVKRIKTAIETQGRLTFHIVADEEQTIRETEKSKDHIYTNPATKEEYELKIIKSPKQFSEKEEYNEEKIVIRRVPGMDGSKVTLAMARRSTEAVGWEIGVRFSAQGQVDFGNLTQQNVKKRMAIMLDGVVHSAPTIQEAIHGECRISGRFDEQEAEKLAGVLTAGSLPAEVKSENEFTVGPTLGAEQIVSGMRATVIGTAAVVSFMLIYYRMSGAIASLCTMLTVIMLLGAMGFFKATLTLPGIAGIVLTLGMSVDANVLILERIREEMQRGRPIRLAVSHGFERAFLTIIDCHVTTIISGVVLYYLGTGPVRGFAVSLTLGILITLFCNLWLNWIITEWLVGREALAKLNMMQFFKATKIDFMGWQRFWITTTVSLAIISFITFLVLKDNLYDVDFKGGTLVQFNFAPDKPQDFETVKKKIEGEVTKGVVDKRAKDFLAELEAQVQNARPEVVLSAGAQSGELQKKRIEEIKNSMKTFSLSPQPFGSPEQGRYRSFRITTSATDPGVIAQLEKELVEDFKSEIEPPPVAREGNMLKIRFSKALGLTEKEAVERVLGAVSTAANDLLYLDIKEPLKALQANAKAETEGNYITVELSPLPPDPKVAQKVEDALGSVKIEGRTGGAISFKSSFGSQVAGEMWMGALIALIVANIGVFIYLWFRFEFSGAWGFGAIVALIHDTLIALGGLIAANLAGYQLLIDLNVVAALLTIIGYSVNDTIVVFDRIREVKGAHPTRPYEEIVNEAVNATLSRTILTSLTVWLADLSLLIFGGPTIRGLAWTLLVGFTIGTYSSIFIASPLMVWWYRRFGGGQAPVPVGKAKQPNADQMAEGAEV